MAHPDKGNTELAAFLNDADERMDDKIKVTARDVASRKKAMKKAGVEAPAVVGNTRGRKPGRKVATPAVSRQSQRLPLEGTGPAVATRVDREDDWNRHGHGSPKLA
jgi:hypothetical protein